MDTQGRLEEIMQSLDDLAERILSTEQLAKYIGITEAFANENNGRTDAEELGYETIAMQAKAILASR